MAFRNKSVNVHQFAMVPRQDIPRSSFRMQHVHKTTIDAGWLYPIYVDEMVPGDRFNMRMTAFARLATPLVPVMDNLHLETFFFFVPNRLLWNNWVKLQGEREDPTDSTDFLVPTLDILPGGFGENTLWTYFGLPNLNQAPDLTDTDINALPFRAYNLIWNEWFRDQNMQNSQTVLKTDGPDPEANYTLLKRGKRHDYFTSALPWTQKGDPVTLPLGDRAPVYGTGGQGHGVPNMAVTFVAPSIQGTSHQLMGLNTQDEPTWAPAPTVNEGMTFRAVEQPLYANLELATSATINLFRLAMQMQVALERDARGGTRYVESIKARFGVTAPDFRLQRPEYIGGGHAMVNISAVPQTSATSASGTDTPQGNLAATGSALAQGHGFTYSATEHGYLIGLMSVRADITYQQGLRKLWSRRTRWDFYEPVFAGLGEQAILNREIFIAGTADDDIVFGYQERFGEYRYFPSLITGYFNSTSATPIDVWHFAEEFASAPVLGPAFIEDSTEDTLARALAVGTEANGQQLLVDMFFDCLAARPMPMYGVPSLGTRF